LLVIPARVRFLSCEPLVGPVDLARIPLNAALIENQQLHWVICGGESGRLDAEIRAMHPAWARSLRDQCAKAGVAFFFKQWGDWLGAEIISPTKFQLTFKKGAEGPKKPDFHHWKDGNPADENVSARVGKKDAGRLLDGREHSAFPGKDAAAPGRLDDVVGSGDPGLKPGATSLLPLRGAGPALAGSAAAPQEGGDDSGDDDGGKECGR
jgi:hypothetical protein